MNRMKLLDAISNANRVKSYFLRHDVNKHIASCLVNIYSFCYGGGVFACRSLMTRFVRRKSSNSTISIVAICKNESDHIMEWLAYHKLIGIDHIYLYDNGSTDDTIVKARSIFDDSFITIIQFPGSRKQFPAYNDALKKYAERHKYIAFIDCDEFIMPYKKGMDIVRCLDNIVEDNNMIGGVCLNWVVYGSSGHKTKPNGLLFENFTHHGDIVSGKGNGCIKSIVMPHKVKRYNHAHYPVYKYGFYGVNVNGNPVDGWRSTPEINPVLRINHYFTKSLEEWKIRRSLGKADNGEDDKRGLEEFYAHDDNSLEDNITSEYINDIKMLLSNTLLQKQAEL